MIILLFLNQQLNLVAQPNVFYEISGKITDQDKNEPLPGVSISIKGTVIAYTVGTSSPNPSFNSKLW